MMRSRAMSAVSAADPGARSAATGRIRVDGRPVAIGAPRQAIAAGLALAPEDRKREGLVLSMSVGENASLASLDRAATQRGCRRS